MTVTANVPRVIVYLTVCFSPVCRSPLQPADVELSAIRQFRRMGRLKFPVKAIFWHAVYSSAAYTGPMLFLGTKLQDQQTLAETVLQVRESHGLVFVVPFVAHFLLDSRQIF